METYMFFSKKPSDVLTPEFAQYKQDSAVLSAMTQLCPTIEFNSQGIVINASSSFLAALGGYSLHEIQGQHHRMFCYSEESSAPAYQRFWQDLTNGKAQSGQFQRIRKDGLPIWIEATYIPVKENGVVTRIFKFAADITEKYNQLISQEALISAFDRSNALIEFSPQGEILQANENFCQAMGYSLNDIRGKHHRMFCFDDFYQQQPNFWKDLAAGHFKSGLFQRKTKHGDIIWLEATYNPVRNTKGQVLKVVKIATDVTQRINEQIAVQKAAEIAHSTSVETAQVSENGAALLTSAINTADLIAKEIEESTVLVDQLNNQSQEISKIVTTIGSIAAQTNLLALNAAIEAARAGENGRGFAVVADEVRNLAARTTQSTGEINQMVNRNTELVTNTKSAMSQITSQATDNSRLILEAAAIIQEILKGAEHVSDTVGRLVHHSAQQRS